MGMRRVNDYLGFKGAVPGVFGSKLDWYIKNPYYSTAWRGWYVGIYLTGAAGDRSGCVLNKRDDAMRMSRLILDALHAMKDGELDMLNIVHVIVRRYMATGSPQFSFASEESSARALPVITDRCAADARERPNMPGRSASGPHPMVLAAMQRRWPDEPPKVLSITNITKCVVTDGVEDRTGRSERTTFAFFRPYQWAAVKASLEGMCGSMLMCGDAPDCERSE